MDQFRIIDFHAHVFPEKVADKAVAATGRYYGITMDGKGTIDDLLEKGTQIGVSRYIIHSTATTPVQVKSVNDFIAKAQKDNRSFIGFGTLHPQIDDIESEVDRIISIGLKGIKLHPDFQEFNIDDQSMMPIYKVLEGKLPVLMHMGDENRNSSSPERLSNVLRLFPDLTVIAAHFGGYKAWDDSEKFLVGKNVYFDTSSALFELSNEEAVGMIRKHGPQKVLFGSDYPMWNHKEELQRFLNLELTQNERELILWKNASRLLGLD
ncbi:MAG TPA: amidohydrolase family protein [Clostridia bacterium]|nr:amidohydrolase family protein [Clostridia bacterium]